MHPAIALHRLAQRARLRLLRRAALAQTLQPQRDAQQMQVAVSRCGGASGRVHVQPRVRRVRGARQVRHRPADRAHQVTVSAHRLFRRHRPQPAAVPHRFRTRTQNHRRRRPIRTPQFRFAACRALRTAHYRMAFAAGIVDRQRDRMPVERRRIPENHPSRDLRRRQAAHGVRKGRRDASRQHCRLIPRDVAQKVLDLAVAPQAVRQTCPARAPGSEHRTEQRLRPVRLHQNPWRSRRQMPPVGRRMRFVQIVVRHRDRERCPASGPHRETHRPEGRLEPPARVPGHRCPRRAEPLFREPRRHSQRTPESRGLPAHPELARHHVALRRQRHQRRLHFYRPVLRGQSGRDLAARADAVQERQNVVPAAPVKGRVESFRNQQRRVAADRTGLEVRREKRPLHRAAVGVRDLEQYSPADRAFEPARAQGLDVRHDALPATRPRPLEPSRPSRQPNTCMKSRADQRRPAKNGRLGSRIPRRSQRQVREFFPGP